MPKLIQVTPLYDFSKELKGHEEVITSSIGPKGEICVLTLLNRREYTEETPGGIFPKVTPKSLNKFRALILKDSQINSVIFKNQPMNYHYIQTLEDEILLVCARSEYYGRDQYDLNAKVFDYNGNLKREFLLGDGIQDVKTTLSGNIWTSYFDEGIFGNYGWSNPIGGSGLRAWNKDGDAIYEYDPPDYDHDICDCYALNVQASDKIWFYFYTSFKLGLIEKDQIEFWDPKISGSDGFIVNEDYVLFRGGYDKRDSYRLMKFEDNQKLRKLQEVAFIDETGNDLKADWIDYRGNKFLIQKGSKIYEIILDNELIMKLG